MTDAQIVSISRQLQYCRNYLDAAMTDAKVCQRYAAIVNLQDARAKLADADTQLTCLLSTPLPRCNVAAEYCTPSPARCFGCSTVEF